jgi:hypothetical protein
LHLRPPLSGAEPGRLIEFFDVLQAHFDLQALRCSPSHLPHLYMKLHSPFRLCLSSAFLLLLATPSFARGFGHKPPPPPKPNRASQRAEARPEFRPQPQANAPRSGGITAPEARPRAQHLEQWMENHKNLSLEEQQRALQNEPGFRELPPQVQQRQINTLARLYAMDPQQRERILNRVEGLERLNPEQQQQWDRAVLQQLNAVAPPRRRLMTRAIIDLRAMPPDQRQQVIDSPAFAAQFSPDERETIRTVLTAY